MQTHYLKNPIPIPPIMDHPIPINPPQLSVHVNAAGEEKSKLSDDDEFLKNLPPGYRFRPSEKELILEYLLKKINNQALPPNRINSVRLYDHSPDHLAESYKASGENEWYFFTPTQRKYKNGGRPDRAAGDGYWKATGADKPIKHNGEKIGFQKVLVFYRGNFRHSVKTHWLMHEFRVKNARPAPQTTQENSMKLDDWVLCKVYKKIISSSSKRRTNKEANDNTARSCREEFSPLPVESSHPISSPRSSSDGTALFSFPYDHQQGPVCLSGSANVRSTFPSHFQGYDPFSFECQESSRLRGESSYPISGPSFSSDGVDLLSFPYHHLQEPPFASESVNGRTIYPSHFQTIEQARRHAINNVRGSDGYTLFSS